MPISTYNGESTPFPLIIANFVTYSAIKVTGNSDHITTDFVNPATSAFEDEVFICM